MSSPPLPEPRAKRLGRALRLPTVSGKVSVAWLVFCFVLAAVLVPMALRLPIWIEFEIVVGVWWVIWVVALTWMLYVGWHVADDHHYTGPRSWLGLWGARKARKIEKGKEKLTAEKSNTSAATSKSSSSWLDALDFDFDDGEGCAWVLAIIVALILLYLGAWLLVEVAIPALAFLLYFAIRGMVAHVVNNGGATRGHALLSLGLAIFWATAYAAPVAGAVWLLHMLHKG
jgi:hypothetical protein